MATITPENQEESSNSATNFLTVTDRHREIVKIFLSAFLLAGMIYGVLVWTEIVPYVF